MIRTSLSSFRHHGLRKNRQSLNKFVTCRWASSSTSLVSDCELTNGDHFTPTADHDALRHMLRDFVTEQIEPQAAEYNRTETFHKTLFQSLGTAQGHALGLLGLTVDETYGGVGWDAAAVAVVHEELSYSDPAFCLSYLAHSLLLLNNLNVNANEAQRARFLPDLTAGTKIGGMAMSEPAAGTDVLGMQTTAQLNDQKEWVLQGRKLWITNGTLDGGQTTGDVFLVYARTGPGRTDITQFIVEKDMPGFTVGQQIKDKLGMRASPTAELVFDQVAVPDETHRVGTVNGATLCMMRNLEIERVGLAAMATGIARRCLDEMKTYAAQRTAFGQDSLYGFGQVQAHLAESYAAYMAGRSYLYATAKALDLQQHGQGLDADGVKLFCAPMAKQVADRAIQVMGGYGYVGEYTVERLWRDSKLLEIGGGTNESHHKNMARDLKKMGDTKLP